MIAALPMYLRPETRAAHDAWWSLIRDHLRGDGIAAPDRLDHDAAPLEGWARPDLVLGQICNLPWKIGFRDRLTLIATADHDLPDTPPGDYHSVLIARTDDPRRTLADFDAARLAINSADSQSGWGAPYAAAQAQAIRFGHTRVTGAHRDSARAVADGAADLAAIDAVTWTMLTRWEGFTDRLRVIARTPPTPGLAYVTAGRVDPAPYRAALRAALDALPPTDRAVLGIRAIVAAPTRRYAALAIPPAPPE